ncbi:DUF2637 domain-containing protein [Streptomyces sp. H27-S2]|uniref:DUF2637 domain-containing protein n=1 Tax=Streptomyces antarcticus TaxID=2996458 RepID=UPI002271AFA8|nr:DUF2637 domain-containing protein [Streptomyces sp. H27-S2]MCY0954136.1 DUF2637 domain-containing protein [Streptomyces sp. H27-S2]
MTDTLTDGQTVGHRAAMAPAAPAMAPATPAAAGVTPASRPGAPAAQEGAPPPPRKGGRGGPGVAGQAVAVAPATGHPVPATVATPEREPGRWIGWLLMGVAVVGMPLVGVIGFAASYSTLERFALGHGFSPTLAPWFPIGVDASIIALLAADLVMVRRRTPWPVLRFAAHAMTLFTILFNASDGIKEKDSVWDGLVADPLWALSHAVMPGLFVLGVEAARKLLLHAARIEDGTAADRIPLHRWVLSPIRTGRLYRRMRLAVVTSYPEMVEREQALEGYRVWLTQELKGDLSRASEVQLLPMTMAPRGYTVEQALALPAKWEADAEQRERAEAERKRVEAERVRRQDKEDRLRVLEDDADVEVATYEKEARTGTAAAQAETVRAEAEAAAAAAKVAAEHRRTAAERQSRAEAEALESAEAAAARLRTARDTEAAERAEAEAERQRALKEKAAADAEAERRRAVRNAEETARAEAGRKAAVVAGAQADKAAADLRYQTAMSEARAQQAEDYARLSPRERSERLVARMLLAAGVDPEQPDLTVVSLSQIMGVLNVGQTAAGDVRKAAGARLVDGYRATTFELMMDGQQP